MHKAVIALLLAALVLSGCSVNKTMQSELVSFSFVHTGSSAAEGWSYAITHNAEGCVQLQVMRGSGAEYFTLPADEALLQSIKQLLVQHDVAAWRGFSLRRMFGAADKASFTLTADFADGSSLTVNGGAPAEDFGEFCAAMHALFAAYLPA